MSDPCGCSCTRSEPAHRVWRTLLWLPAWLMLSGAVAASDAEPVAPQEDMLHLENVTVTAMRRPLRLLEVAEAVSMIEHQAITREAPGVLAEMLRGQAGAFFQQTTPGQGIPIIRGLKGSEVLHLVDGMRLNNAFFRNAPNQYLGLVDAYATDRLEVVRGSAPSLHGADAMGGVVQVLTAEPDFSGEDWQQEGRLYGSFNSVDTGVTTRASAALGKMGNALSGGFTWQSFGDRKTGGGETVSPTGYKVRAGDLKWRKAVSAAAELMLSAQVLEQPSTSRIDELVPGYGQEQPSSILNEFRPNRRFFLHARYRQSSQSKWFEHMEIHAARQVITDDRLTQDFDDPVQTTEFNSSTLDGVTLQFNSPWSMQGEIQRDLVWGMEYYTDTVSSRRIKTDTQSGASEDAAGRFPDDSTMDSIALYASNRWQRGRLTFEAGLRYSKFDIHLPGRGEVPAADLQPDDLTGDVHAAWEFRPGLKMVSNIGRGFRPPNIFDLGTLGARPGNRFNVPNPDLKPESVWSYDLGLKSVGSRWESELFLFYSDYHDKITSVFTGDITPEGRLVVRSENLNRATLYGIESGMRWYYSDNLQVYGVLNYTHGEEQDVQSGTVPADRVPPLNGRIGMVYVTGNGPRFESWVYFAGSQNRLSPRDMEDPRINPEGTDGYATLNALLSWPIGDRLEIGLRLENLSDINYREHGSGIDSPGRNVGFWFNANF